MQMPAMTEVQGQAAASRLVQTRQRLKLEKGKKNNLLFIFMSVCRMATLHCWIINDALIEKGMRTSIDWASKICHMTPPDYHMIGADCLTLAAHCGDTSISSREKMW